MAGTDVTETKAELRTPYSPWSQQNRVEETRTSADAVVGWRRGIALKAADVEALLKKDRHLRHEHKARVAQLQLPLDDDPGQPASSSSAPAEKKKEAPPVLPPHWEAFFSAVPGTDVQAAYREYLREQKQRNKANQPDADLDDEEADVAQLEEAVRQRSLELRKKRDLLAELDQKLAQAKKRDAESEEQSRRVARKLETASYEHGMMEGKIRSSDTYFQFMHEDGSIMHAKKVNSLRRSCALMQKQIDTLKGEVRVLKNLESDMASTDMSVPNNALLSPGTPSSQQVAGVSDPGSPAPMAG